MQNIHTSLAFTFIINFYWIKIKYPFILIGWVSIKYNWPVFALCNLDQYSQTMLNNALPTNHTNLTDSNQFPTFLTDIVWKNLAPRFSKLATAREFVFVKHTNSRTINRNRENLEIIKSLVNDGTKLLSNLESWLSEAYLFVSSIYPSAYTYHTPFDLHNLISLIKTAVSLHDVDRAVQLCVCECLFVCLLLCTCVTCPSTPPPHPPFTRLYWKNRQGTQKC
jgi:hypothetical protein